MNEATIAKKQELVQVVLSKMSNAGSTVFVDYLGLTVAEVTDLRIKLRAENCEMKVIKNNILRRAAEKVGYGVDANSLVGPSAAVFSEDEVAASKVLYTFAKEHKITVKSGIVGGVAIALTSFVPFVGWLCGILGTIVDLYVVGGIVILFLAHFKVIK